MKQPYAKYSVEWEACADQLGSGSQVLDLLHRSGCQNIHWSVETVHRDAVEIPEPIVEIDVAEVEPRDRSPPKAPPTR